MIAVDVVRVYSAVSPGTACVVSSYGNLWGGTADSKNLRRYNCTLVIGGSRARWCPS